MVLPFMTKLKMDLKMMLIKQNKVYGVLLILLLGLSHAYAKQEVVGDYHVTSYIDVQGSLEGFEAFTKVADKKVFFGVSCSIQSPMPLMQVIAFDSEVVSESPKYLEVIINVDKGDQQSLNGILSVIDNADEYSNKVRFEIAATRGGSFQDLQDQYLTLLGNLSQGEELTLELKHRTLKTVKYEFSLVGLKKLLQDRMYICK